MDVRTYVEKDRDPWDLLKAGVNKRRAALLKKHIGKAGLVLDIGCAFGIYSAFLRNLGNYVISLDASKRMVSEGNSRFNELTFTRGRAEELPFKDDTFNAVLCVGTLIYSSDRKKFLAELYRALRKRGKLCVIERNRSSPLHGIIGKIKRNEKYVDARSSYFTKGEMKKLLTEADFKITKISGDEIALPVFSGATHKLAETFPSFAYFLVFECEKP